MRCNISCEPAGEVWDWSLFGVNGLIFVSLREDWYSVLEWTSIQAVTKGLNLFSSLQWNKVKLILTSGCCNEDIAPCAVVSDLYGPLSTWDRSSSTHFRKKERSTGGRCRILWRAKDNDDHVNSNIEKRGNENRMDRWKGGRWMDGSFTTVLPQRSAIASYEKEQRGYENEPWVT